MSQTRQEPDRTQFCLSALAADCYTLMLMHPSFGVPWPRLQRAAARLDELHRARREPGRVPALLFLCGIKYLLTYRRANGKRLSHYLDDGLRETVDHTLSALMERCAEIKPAHLSKRPVAWEPTNPCFEQLVQGMVGLRRRYPSATRRWLGVAAREANWVRLAFGMGVDARFHPASHDFTKRMLAQPLVLPAPLLDVIESFHWHPQWSLALAR